MHLGETPPSRLRTTEHQSALVDFGVKWGNRTPPPGRKWPKRVPVIELLYSLVFWFPDLYDDPEGQVYLEVFMRQLAASEVVNSTGGELVVIAGTNADRDSTKDLLQDFILPIASGSVGVEEDLIGSFPRDELSVLSIHQSKGLEFPLTIVDVGSDFASNRAAKFRRFPSDGSRPHRMEDLLRPYTGLAGSPARTQIDRSFDDLYRQYFVAFSRAQDVLLLVGLDAAAPGGNVANVATGWRRNGTPAWTVANRPFIPV